MTNENTIVMSFGDFNLKANDKKHLKEINNIIKMGVLAFKPDLVVVYGSLLDTSVTTDEYPDLLKQALSSVINANIPICYFGEHPYNDFIPNTYKALANCVGVNDDIESSLKIKCNLIPKCECTYSPQIRISRISEDNELSDVKIYHSEDLALENSVITAFSKMLNDNQMGKIKPILELFS
ncbi:MAG: hypothetical protein KIG53_06835 [Oscillospiraceae bacterium]|nr:hypothetical protein [Oscillospiraceae bacterium]